MNNNYDCVYDQDTGHFIVNGATVLFPNFSGVAQQYNQEGKRNFKLVVDESLANTLKEMGVFIKERPPRDETEEMTYQVKIGVYSDAEILFVNGKAKTPMLIDGRDPENDDGPAIDREFRKGHVYNGDIRLEFHVSKNTKYPNSSPYLRLDGMVIPIRKSRLMSEYEDYDEE